MNEWGPLPGGRTYDRNMEDETGGDLLRSLAQKCETCRGTGNEPTPRGEPFQPPCPACGGSGYKDSPGEVAQRIRNALALVDALSPLAQGDEGK